MGLFSQTDKYLGTSVSRAIPDAMLPNSPRSSISQAILGQDRSTSMADAIVRGLVGSLAVNANAMYTYARDHYTWGLPSGQYLASSAGRDLVQARLEALEGGSPVTLIYCNVGPANLMHLAWERLASLWGYQGATNELAVMTADKGFTVYLDDLCVTVPADRLATYPTGVIAQWGVPARFGLTPKRPALLPVTASMRAHTPIASDPAATGAYAQVSVMWAGTPASLAFIDLPGGLQAYTESFTFSLEGLADELADYFQVRYEVGGEVKFWSYRSGAGTYPELDALHDLPAETGGTYMPMTYFRFGGVSQAEDTGSDAYITSKKMLKHIGMDFATVAQAIDENPDVDDVDQAMLVFALPANTTDALEARYLFEFFDARYFAREEQWIQPGSSKVTRALGGDVAEHTTVIQDQQFKLALSDRGIVKRRVAGSIGAIGSHTCVVSSENEIINFTDMEIGASNSLVLARSVHAYRKQISSSMYEELLVSGLTVQYWFGGYMTIGDDTDPILLVPIDRSIAQQYSLPEREQLYARSLHYVFNSVVLVKLAWYQTDLFQAVITFAAVAMTVASQGATLDTLISAVASGSTEALTTAVLDLVVKFAVSTFSVEIFKALADAVGGPLAAALAVVAAITSGMVDLPGSGLPGAPFAKDLLQLANGLLKGASALYGEKIQQLGMEMNQLGILAEQGQAELERANSLLANDNWLSPITIFGESPDSFYNRTAHSGNIGIQSIGAISSYVDTALRLPSLADTLGGITNG